MNFVGQPFTDPCLLTAVTDEDTVKRYYAKFEEKFFQTCEKELAKINTFYSGKQHTVMYTHSGHSRLRWTTAGFKVFQTHHKDVVRRYS